MKLPICVAGPTLLCTTLLSTFCLVLCFDVDAERQQQHLPSSLKESADHAPWSTLNDRVALKELYEMYRDGEPLWKRAPAAGFFGMRGKKVPGQNFYGMRGKKGPSGFLGMRGKKMMAESKLARLESPLLDTEDLWVSKDLVEGLDEGRQNSQHQLLGDNLPIDHVDDKRAPANGFMGLRGKRNASPQDVAAPSTTSNTGDEARTKSGH